MPSLCVFHPIWVLGGGVGSQGVLGTTCLCSFPASAAQKRLFLSPLRGALLKAMEFLLGEEGGLLHFFGNRASWAILFFDAVCFLCCPTTAVAGPQELLEFSVLGAVCCVFLLRSSVVFFISALHICSIAFALPLQPRSFSSQTFSLLISFPIWASALGLVHRRGMVIG